MTNYKSSVILAGLCLFLSTAHAQVTTASIAGRVVDPSDAVVPGVTVSVRNLETGMSRTVATDEGGRYRVFGLSPGAYTVSVEMTGFKREVRSSIDLTVGQELTLNFALTVGAVVENLLITSEAVLVETASAALSGVVDDKQIRDLPLNARSFIQLSFLQPGVTEFKFTRPNVNGGRTAKVIVNGLRPTSNSFWLDGTYVNDAIGRTPGSTTGVFLGIDTVREFRVLTNSYSAQYGMAAGGVVSAVTKSGANVFQGSVFYFHRNDNLDARNFFDREKPEFRRHQFGATLGGPIETDRTFFFGAIEGFRESKGFTRVVQVPSRAARSGQIVSVADEVRPYLSLFPIPNGPDLGSGLAEHRFSQDEVADETFYQIRVDHTFSSQDTVFVRYTFDDASVVLPAPNPNPLAVVDEPDRNQYVTLEYQRIITPQFLNTARVTFNRTHIRSANRFLQPIDPGLAFIPGHPLGNLRIGGIGEWGPNRFLPVRRLRNLYGFADDLASAQGRHSIRTGLIINRFQDNNFSSAAVDGAYEFASITEFLQGRPTSFQVSTANSLSDRAWRQWLFGFYVQDDFKATGNLTLNLGLRYEFTTVLTEANGRVQSLRDVLRDADVTLGDPIYRNPSLRNLAPRLGVAWDPFGTGKTAIRAGFGLFHDPYLYSPLYPSHQNAVPFVQRATIRNPAFPFQPLPASLPNTTQSIILSDFNPDNPYSMQYNVNVQRELVGNLVVMIGYVGSRGVNLLRGGQINRPISQIVNGRTFFPAGARRRNPNWGDIDWKRTDGNSWYHALQISGQMRFSRGAQVQVSYTFSRTIDEGSGVLGDDASTGSIDPQDPDNRKNERGLTAFHAKHNLAVNYTYDLPFRSSQEGVVGKILGGWQVNGILSVRSGMPFTVGIESDRSRSFTRTAGQIRPDVLPGASMDQAILGNDGFRRTGRFFDPFIFTLQAQGFLGNAGRNSLIGPDLATVDFSLVKNSRAAFLGESGRIQWRMELFNLFNRANFSSPDRVVFAGTATMPDPCSPQFECPLPSAGRVTSTATDARQIQFGIKILF